MKYSEETNMKYGADQGINMQQKKYEIVQKNTKYDAEKLGNMMQKNIKYSGEKYEMKCRKNMRYSEEKY